MMSMKWQLGCAERYQIATLVVAFYTHVCDNNLSSTIIRLTFLMHPHRPTRVFNHTPKNLLLPRFPWRSVEDYQMPGFGAAFVHALPCLRQTGDDGACHVPAYLHCRFSKNSSVVTCACFRIPARVPVATSRCSGTTQPASPAGVCRFRIT